ncbi:MAG: ribose-5-phosphate isomerase RpiA [Planctomycetes bacterium]|nr:ribose-5-phosphate isomerase RpiA [Planctomycetota bacterium]
MSTNPSGSHDPKAVAGAEAARRVEDGMLLGLGTGSTAEHFVRALAKRMHAEHLKVHGVPTSLRTEALARELGIPLLDPSSVAHLDLTVDGADEVDPKLNLIKGGGGALLREKILASISKRELILVDPSKRVAVLGICFPLPVEVLPFARAAVERGLKAARLEPVLRVRDQKPVLSDNGNLLFDCRSNGIHDPRALERELLLIPGVIEVGLFCGLTSELIVGYADGRVECVKG